MIERPQWCRPSAAVRALALLCCLQALFGLVARVRERPEGSTDPSGGFRLSVVSDA